MEQRIIDFIKNLMQPILTVVAILLFWGMAIAGKFPAEDVEKVVVGIILFWFGYTAIKNFTYTGKSGGDTESTGTPPKASSGASTAAADGAAVGANYNVPADTWNGQGGWDSQKATAIPEPEPQVEVTKFDRVDFDKKVVEMAKNTLSWSDMSPASLYNAAVTVYWAMFPVGDKVSLEMIQALIDYAEPAFMQIFELDSAKWTPQSYMTWLNTPADKCGGVCKPPITEGKKVMLVRLGNYYATRLELESKLGK
jgi:hypothetical protein